MKARLGSALEVPHQQERQSCGFPGARVNRDEKDLWGWPLKVIKMGRNRLLNLNVQEMANSGGYLINAQPQCLKCHPSTPNTFPGPLAEEALGSEVHRAAGAQSWASCPWGWSLLLEFIVASNGTAPIALIAPIPETVDIFSLPQYNKVES